MLSATRIAGALIVAVLLLSGQQVLGQDTPEGDRLWAGNKVPTKHEFDVSLARWNAWRNKQFPKYHWEWYGTPKHKDLDASIVGDSYAISINGNTKEFTIRGDKLFQLLERYVEGEAVNINPLLVEDGTAMVAIHPHRLSSVEWRLIGSPATPAQVSPKQ